MFTLITNTTAINNCTITTRCSSPNDTIPLYILKKTSYNTIPNLLKNAIITPITIKPNLNSSEFLN